LTALLEDYVLECKTHNVQTALYSILQTGKKYVCAQVATFFSGVSVPLAGGALETGINYSVYSSTLAYLSSRYPPNGDSCKASCIPSADYGKEEPAACKPGLGGDCPVKPKLEASDGRKSYTADVNSPPSHRGNSTCAEEGKSPLAQQLSPPQLTQHLKPGTAAINTPREATGCSNFSSAQCTDSRVGANGFIEPARDTSGGHVAQHPPLTHIAIAGAIAGVALSFVLSPVELIKCRLQVSVPGQCWNTLPLHNCPNHHDYVASLQFTRQPHNAAASVQLSPISVLPQHIFLGTTITDFWVLP
jgi:hypothetical protein